MYCEFPPLRCSTSLVTFSIPLPPSHYNGLNNPKLCIVTGSDCVSAPNCYKKEQQLIPYFKVKEKVDIDAVKNLDEVGHSLKPFVRGSHLVSCITFRSRVASCGPRGGRNNNNCGLMEFVNIVIPKVLIFVNVSLYRP